MSAPAITTVLTAPSGARWHEVEPGFHVGKLDGEHLGFIDTTADGSLVAFDNMSTPVGRFVSLQEAKRAIVEVQRGETGSQRTARLAQVYATASGLLSVVLLIAAAPLFIAL
jgi:hypothetical protein